ncbi:hypothetical protein K435DRAFT_834304 [Dendrothele bispora CBS 962.96]|uniref:GPR1/FUN34/YaaH-class plasma membrane protein n=1 Tax=Dendrothele bispora (strain CBS 962.96) TaxID=1314807 RepID=A0A4S8MUL8_DENBC|nr:hypothetical protein K435DRAFT_834304 [Dendrothele bispora CBS 962.96]
MAMAIHNNTDSDIEKGSSHHIDRPPVQLTSEQYEKLFLQPGGRIPAGGLSLRFGNPTPLPVLCYLLLLTPTSAFLMGWGGADATSMTTMVGPFYFLGGVGMSVGAVMEWILGNTFPFVVFMTFSGFWLSLATLQDPLHAIASAFTGGTEAAAYNKGLMFFFAFWTVAVTFYLICSLRTNVAFVLIFLTLTPLLALLSAGYGQLGNGNVELGQTLMKASGACAFANACIAWYLFASLLFRAVDMPFTLPVGDLSGFMRKRNRDIETRV